MLTGRSVARSIPDVLFVPYLAGVEGHVYHGRDGIETWLTEMDQAFRVIDPDVRSVVSLDDHHVLALGHTVLTGRESGAAIDFEWAQVVRIEGDRIVSVWICRDEAAALEAAGLSEQGDHDPATPCLTIAPTGRILGPDR